MPCLQLIEELTHGPVPPGSSFLVEYDPASQWYNASLTVAAGWLRTGGRVAYNVASQPPTNIRLQLRRLGVDTEAVEENDSLDIYDWYSATLGQKSLERLSEESLKVADMSIGWMKEAKELAQSASRSGGLMIVDDVSSLDRFNEEKAWVEFVLTRLIARQPVRSDPSIALIGVIKGLHSERVYKRLEAAFHCILDLQVDESGEGTRNSLRIRGMRNAHFDSRWHGLRIAESFAVELEK